MPITDYSLKALRPAEGFYNSEVQVPKRRPIRTFLPKGYEPNYPYPLVVFLHGFGGNEQQIMRLAPKLSRRNPEQRAVFLPAGNAPPQSVRGQRHSNCFRADGGAPRNPHGFLSPRPRLPPTLLPPPAPSPPPHPP